MIFCGFRGIVIKYRSGIRVMPKHKRWRMSPYDELLGKLTKNGKKRRARLILKRTIRILYKLRFLRAPRVRVFNKFWKKRVLKRLSPIYDLSSRIYGMHTIYTPRPIYQNRSKFYAYKWFFLAVSKRKGRTFLGRFVAEIIAVRLRLKHTKAYKEYAMWHKKGLANLALMGRPRLPGGGSHRRKKRKRIGYSRRLDPIAPPFYKGLGYMRRKKKRRWRRHKKYPYIRWARFPYQNKRSRLVKRVSRSLLRKKIKK